MNRGMTIKTHFFAVAFGCLLVSASTSFSQTFQRTFGNTGSQTGTCIKSTLDGNYIIAGMASGFSNGYEDVYLEKMDTGGNLLWSKAYGGTYKDRAYYLSTCSDGGFIVTGSTSVFTTGSNTNLLLLRTDSDGNIGWSVQVGGSADDFGWYTDQANDGGFIAVGSTKSFNTGNWDGYVVKTDAAGTLQWTKVIGGSNSDEFHGMNKTSDGGYIVTGLTSTNSFGSSDIWLMKLNSVGDTLWTRQYGKATEDAGNSVVQTSDGGYIIAGDIHVNPAAGNHNSCLVKTDASGTLQWAKTYGSNPGTEIAWDVRQTSNGGYLFSGASAFYGNGGGGDILTIRTDNAGNMKWARAYGGTSFDDFWYSTKTPDEGNMLVGLTYEGGHNILVVRADSLGNSTCNTTTVSPDVNIPVLQVRSGTTVITGGTASIPAFLLHSAPVTSTDPCALVALPENMDLTPRASIYPNPLSRSATLLVTGPLPPGTELGIYDLLGNCVLKQAIKSEYLRLDLDLKKGIYFYKLYDSGGVLSTGKIIAE